ncbi:MAG: aldo/keto reductase [Christensenellales bacterium]|jgi:L-glyceraldehyde 3-phosphate reductase
MYQANEKRYEGSMEYRRTGKSGLMLPMISLGLWHNFGAITPFETQKQVLCTAFDNGITHFDLANNYGPPYGEAERNFGQHMERDFRPYRDELILSTKAGYDMWKGPYGDHGSRKYLIASLDQSLKRMKVDYVDIFYHHRPDFETPIEETMQTLADIVRSGKALYVGISNYPADRAALAIDTLEKMGVHMLIHQPSYSLMNRWVEDGLTDVLAEKGVGMIAFAPLAGGLLTGKYNRGLPEESRAVKDPRYLRPESITQEKIDKVARLTEIAAARGQSMAQMALSWVLRNETTTSALIGASRPEQILENVQAVKNTKFTEDEERAISAIL